VPQHSISPTATAHVHAAGLGSLLAAALGSPLLQPCPGAGELCANNAGKQKATHCSERAPGCLPAAT
jgi:hypothetical protein